MSERSGERERSQQCGASERTSAAERTSEASSGKQASERGERMSERMSEWPSIYIPISRCPESLCTRRFSRRAMLSEVSFVYEERIRGGLGECAHVPAPLPSRQSRRHAQFALRIALITIPWSSQSRTSE